MRKLLPVYTFAAILSVIVLVGLAVVPLVLRLVESKYLDIQGDINRRQAEAFARFVEFRLAQGISQEQILSELNGMLAHADVDRGFSCVISLDTHRFVSHPIPGIVGRPVASLGVEFESSDHRNSRMPMEESIPEAGSREGIFHLPNSRREVVFMQSIPSARWTVATHENTARVDHELSDNFGISLSLWDWIFHTAYWPTRHECPAQQPDSLGFPGMEKLPHSQPVRFAAPLWNSIRTLFP